MISIDPVMVNRERDIIVGQKKMKIKFFIYKLEMARALDLQGNIYIDTHYNLFFGGYLVDSDVIACNASGFYIKRDQHLYSNKKLAMEYVDKLNSGYVSDRHVMVYDLFLLARKIKARVKTIVDNSEKYMLHNFSNAFALSKQISINIILMTLFCIGKYKIFFSIYI